MKLRYLLIFFVMLFMAAGCDRWGYKEAYEILPATKTAESAAGETEADELFRKVESALNEIADEYGLVPIQGGEGLVYSVRDYPDHELSRGSISVYKVQLDSGAKVGLYLSQFSSLREYGEEIFDKAVNLANDKYGANLVVVRKR